MPKRVARKIPVENGHKWCCTVCFKVYQKQDDAQFCCAPEKVKREMVDTKTWLKASMKPKNPSIGILHTQTHTITYCPEETP